MDRPFSKLPLVSKPNVFLAIPMSKNTMLHAKTAAFCSAMNQHSNVLWGYVGSMSAEFSRNSLLEHHFHNDPNWTHVCFVDSDVDPPLNALKLLLSVDADVATGLYPLFIDGKPVWSVAKPENENVFFALHEELPKEPFVTKSCGGGILLIRREVLVDMGWPWFETQYQEIYKNKGKGILCGEDVYFCRKAAEKGYPTIVVPSVICEHYNQVGMKRFYDGCVAPYKTETAGGEIPPAIPSL